LLRLAGNQIAEVHVRICRETEPRNDLVDQRLALVCADAAAAEAKKATEDSRPLNFRLRSLRAPWRRRDVECIDCRVREQPSNIVAGALKEEPARAGL
jgi:hypothetical protein